MKHWLASTHVRIDKSVLKEIQKFALAAEAAPHIVSMARSMADMINIKVHERFLVFIITADPPDRQIASQDPPPPTSPVMQVFTDKPSSDSLAKALTILEGEEYTRILPSDYVVHLLQPSIPGHIAAVSTTKRKIVFWVSKSILSPRHFKERAHVFRFFAQTAIVRSAS
jgi:hypothetical protein